MKIENGDSQSNNKIERKNPWFLQSKKQGIANHTIHEAMNETEFDKSWYNRPEMKENSRNSEG